MKNWQLLGFNTYVFSFIVPVINLVIGFLNIQLAEYQNYKI